MWKRRQTRSIGAFVWFLFCWTSFLTVQAQAPPTLLTVTANDPDNLDGYYSNADRLTLVFDTPTNQPAVATKAQIDAYFTFGVSLGTNYTGAWSNASTLVITIANFLGHGYPTIGATTITVKAASGLRDAINVNNAAVVAVTIGGNWGTAATTPFGGGLADGHTTSRYTNPFNCGFSYGGNYGGFAKFRRPNPDSCGLFYGGVADGFARGLRPNPTNCDLFFGGNGDGYANNKLPTVCVMYLGGNGDGYARSLRPNPFPCSLFFGSNGDGYAMARNPTVCVMYLGGDGDGYARNRSVQVVCPMYFGGIADGFATSMVSPPVTAEYWLGVNHNWFDTQNWSRCKVPDCDIDVIIPATANNPRIQAATAACKSITIQTGADLRVDNTFSLDVCGNILNQGTLTAQTTSFVNLIGTVDQELDGALNLTNAFAGLRVNKATGKVILKQTVEVSQQLALVKGLIQTDAFEISVLNRSVNAINPFSSVSYVEGNLRRYLNATGSYSFPVGEATKGYQWANINFTVATSIDNLRAFFKPYAVLPNLSLSTNECGSGGYSGDMLNNGCWTIDAFPAAAANTGKYTATLYNANYSNAGNSHTVVKRPSGGAGAWALNGLCTNTSTAAQTVRTGMQGFSDFGVGIGVNPFPIELLSLSATALEDEIQLDWATGFEQNNKGFDVQRSLDATHFETIGWRDGHGVSTKPIAYQFNDADVLPNKIYYYRLKQNDFNGVYAYSNVVQAMLSRSAAFDVRVYPNPATDLLNLNIRQMPGEKMTVSLTDLLGQTIITEEVLKDQNRVTFDLSGIAAGVYLLKLQSGGQSATFKFAKTE